jgi:hypothetical protein
MLEKTNEACRLIGGLPNEGFWGQLNALAAKAMEPTTQDESADEPPENA